MEIVVVDAAVAAIVVKATRGRRRLCRARGHTYRAPARARVRRHAKIYKIILLILLIYYYTFARNYGIVYLPVSGEYYFYGYFYLLLSYRVYFNFIIIIIMTERLLAAGRRKFRGWSARTAAGVAPSGSKIELSTLAPHGRNPPRGSRLRRTRRVHYAYRLFPRPRTHATAARTLALPLHP